MWLTGKQTAKKEFSVYQINQCFNILFSILSMKKIYYTKKWEDKIIQACKTSRSMIEAYTTLGMNHNTFKSHAIRLGVYKPNQAGKGCKKNNPKIPLSEIIYEGKQPQYHSYGLKKRLLKEGIKQYQCEMCKRTMWGKNPIPLELHHIDGNKRNHLLENLLVICPNCHTFTLTYKSKNKNNGVRIEKIRKPRKLKKVYICEQCGAIRNKRSNDKVCRDCYNISQRRLEVSKEELTKLMNEYPMTKIGKMFNVSDKSIKKRAVSLEII